MKPLPGTLTGEVVDALPNRRAQAKLQTRQKVLAAARQMFAEQGYEGATIRDIATAAGMSTGAVFANFTDKSDLFCDIMNSDMVQLVAAVEEAVAGETRVEAALTTLFTSAFRFYQSQLPLARAAFCVAWTPDHGHDVRNLPSLGRLRALITEQLEAGVARGELVAEAEIPLRTTMLFSAFLSNFPQAIFRGYSCEDLEARARDQVRILLAGALKT